MTSPDHCGSGIPFVANRRRFLNTFGMGLGGMALASMWDTPAACANGLVAGPHFAPKAKRVIYLFQSGAPSQIDLFDHKPLLCRLHGTELPESVRRGKRLTAMTGSQASFRLAQATSPLRRHGESGAWLSDAMPHTAEVVDEICFIKSIHSEAINHGPAVTYFQTGSQFPGRPSMGAWLDYGLGSDNENLPAFVVLVTKDKRGQPLVSRLWGSAFLPSKYQGVRFRSGKDPVLYLGNPAGVDTTSRRAMLDRLRELHELALARSPDPMIETRIAQYELAFRMQNSVPEATDLSSEPAWVFEAYGEDSRIPGTYAANCILARRLAERGVRFIQLYHPGWDHHDSLPGKIAKQCRETDQPTAALLKDLKRRGMLDDTLVVWGGEFGRTNYCQGTLTGEKFGRDHHPHCFTIWMAGGGIRPGMTWGETDEYSYNVSRDPVHVHDLQATILHLLGIDHERLTFKYQGRRFRLTDVHGRIVRGILA